MPDFTASCTPLKGYSSGGGGSGGGGGSVGSVIGGGGGSCGGGGNAGRVIAGGVTLGTVSGGLTSVCGVGVVTPAEGCGAVAPAPAVGRAGRVARLEVATALRCFFVWPVALPGRAAMRLVAGECFASAGCTCETRACGGFGAVTASTLL